MNHKILIVDDEPANLRVLERLIASEYEAVTANSGAEALELLSRHDFAMIVSDQRMPGMSGLDLLKRAARIRQQTIRILLTGYTDVETLVEAINSGVVYKYATKPWSNDDLMLLVKRGLEYYESVKRSHRSELDNSRISLKLDAARKAVALLLAENVKLRSPELLDHAERIGRYARVIADLLAQNEPQVELISSAAYMFPRVYGPSTVRGVLGGEAIGETELALRTAELEAALALFADLRPIEEFSEIGEILRYAGEHFDGTGFPNRLSGESIPLASRILAVARGYDLMTSVVTDGHRMSHEEAVRSMLNPPRARIFDPAIVETLNRLGFVSQIPESLLAHRHIDFGHPGGGPFLSAS